MNFIAGIAERASTTPDQPAVIDGDRVLTYAGLIVAVAELGGRLQSVGIQPGDVVGLRLKDDADHIIAILALGWIGAGSASVDWRAKPVESRAVLERLGIARLLVDKPHPAYRSLDHLVLTDLTPASHPPSQATDVGGHPFVVNLSSGTTGAPRGVAVTFQQYTDRMARYFKNYGPIAGYRYLSVTPLCFSAGRNLCLYALLGGATVVMHPTLFSGQDYLDAARRHRINMGFLVPAAARWLLAIDEPAPLLGGFAWLEISGDAVSESEHRLFRQRLTPNLFHTYSTSGTGILTCLIPSDGDDLRTSVGRPLHRVEIEIVDDRGAVLEAGEVGRIRCRGPGIATDAAAACIGDPRYVHDGTIDDGWFYTGELGAFDDNGYLYIKGRVSTVIIRGGVNIFPDEIEEVILLCRPVREVAVMAKPSLELGEAVAAFVVSSERVSAEAIRKHCRARLVAHKIPEDIYFVERLPRTTSGKVDKQSLSRRFDVPS
jgi:acyl-CoA synthetase (AMP-forming)/AMP-acid ligase II